MTNINVSTREAEIFMSLERIKYYGDIIFRQLVFFPILTFKIFI